MAWHSSLDLLRDALADLYPTAADARTLLASAGLDGRQIAFDARPSNTWFAILDEAQKQGKTGAIMQKALEKYPAYAPLLQARDAYQTWQQVPAVIPVATSPRVYKLTNPQKWQLVDGLLLCPAIANRKTRDSVVDGLRNDIKFNTERDDNARLDVLNLVNTALNYAGGLDELIDAVRAFDRGSEPMAAVDQILASFG